ncbi:glycosyltransferase [Halobiforma nitratireducens]|uniref:Group 1 glycosyl transferase n=1 Tax=Halobiforma nitratireducens JCM 10879 TaxID=1227454 RepID=M0MN86_9EURY|nr:glycosyltransferase [Halobiforma nitratireducens]EMA47111.1 group 1 glycosyl transferase [Halobiforma nitratireducens JCM 10879]
MGGSRTDIWYLIGTLSVGGAERTLVDLANGLDPDRFDVTIWTILEPGPLAGDVHEHVTVRSLGAANKADLRAPLRFVSALRRHQPDILQSFLFYDNTLATIAGLACSQTTVITGVRAVPNDPSIPRSLVRRVTCRLADHIVSNSEAGIDFILEHGADPGSVSVVHNGRDLEAYRNGEATPELRESLEIPPDAPVVGTVGRLIERKGHYDLLEAWPLVLDDHPDAQLVIVGDGPERDGLEARARELGVWDSVHLPGTRDDVPALLDLMDVFAFPSHFEGLPGALLEAMAAGLPIVATPVDGNSELLDDEQSGLFVPVQAPDALASAICRLLSQESFATSISDEATHVATTDFSLERMVGDFTTVYEERPTY